MRIILTKEDLDNTRKNGGLEIVIEGCKGDLEDASPGTAVWIENHHGTIRCHAWDGINQNPASVTLH